MKTSKIRIGTVAGVLALPLIAILAMVMFFSFSQYGPEQAQAASQGSVTAMRLDVPSNAEVGSTFNVSIVADLTPADPIAGFAVQILVDTGAAGVSYNGSDDCFAEVKVRAASGADPSFCDSATPVLTGGHNWSVLTTFNVPPPALDIAASSKVTLVNASYSCDTVGTHRLSLGVQPSDPDGALFGAVDGSEINVKSEAQDVDTDGDTTADFTVVADTVTIACVPQGVEINIGVVDSANTTQNVPDACLAVSYTDTAVSPVAQIIHDVVGDNGKTCANATGKFTDSNSAVGNLSFTVSGKQRLEFGDEWQVQIVQVNSKYALNNTKFSCDLSRGKCNVELPVNQVNGNLTVTFFDNRQSGPVPLVATTADELCVSITTFGQGDLGQFCAGVGNSSLTTNLNAPDLVKVIFKEASCVEPLEFDDKGGSAPSTAQLALGHAASGGKQISASFSCASAKVFHLKTPSLSNLFLSNQQGEAKAGLEVEVGTTIAPQTCRAGTDVALFTNSLSIEPASQNPKGDAQSVAAFEMTIRYDPQWVCVNVVPGDYWFLQANKTNPFASGNVRAAAQAIADSADPVTGGGAPITLSTGAGGVVCFIDDKNDGLQPTGMARIGCVVTKSQLKDIDQTLPLAYVLVKPQPEVYNQIIPNQDNGIVTMILNSGCNLADLEGHAIDSSGCDDSVLTIRWLEADFNGDCVVDVIDQQAVSMRWGASVGSLLYDARMDTMPYGNIKGDGFINIKDVQFAYGRNGSVCDEQNRFKFAGPTNPEQNPVPNK